MIHSNTQKECSKCHTIKQICEFSKNRSAYDGLNSWCKICQGAGSEQSRKARMKENQIPPQNCPDKLVKCPKCHKSLPLTSENFHYNRSKKSGWNPKCILCQREEGKIASRKYNQKHPEKRKILARNYRRNNIEHVRGYHRKWRKEHMLQHTFSGKLAKAKKRGYTWNIDLESYLEHFWNKPCAYCGNPNNGGVDRVDNNIGYIINNCLPCCRWCNLIKFTKSTEEMNRHLIQMLKHQKVIS